MEWNEEELNRRKRVVTSFAEVVTTLQEEREERGLPYMTSGRPHRGGSQKYHKFVDKQYIKFGQRGVKKYLKFVVVIYGSPKGEFLSGQSVSGEGASTAGLRHRDS